MKIILPGAAVGLLGGGENGLMLALAAYRMGYRVHVYSPDPPPAGQLADVFVQAPYDDLDRVREFAAGVDVVTAAGNGVPVLTLRAAESKSAVYPSASSFETIENGIGAIQAAGGLPLAEFSIIAARGIGGAFVSYPPLSIENAGNVFDAAHMASSVRARVATEAAGLARDTLDSLNFTGIASLDFALTQTSEILVRDVTPYADRAGQLTADCCVTSQFEQQIRAICGLPPGSTAMLSSAAMVNLPESIWASGQPDWASALALPSVKLTLYGDRRGHLSACAASATLAKQIVLAARAALVSKELQN